MRPWPDGSTTHAPTPHGQSSWHADQPTGTSFPTPTTPPPGRSSATTPPPRSPPLSNALTSIVSSTFTPSQPAASWHSPAVSAPVSATTPAPSNFFTTPSSSGATKAPDPNSPPGWTGPSAPLPGPGDPTSPRRSSVPSPGAHSRASATSPASTPPEHEHSNASEPSSATTRLTNSSPVAPP